MIERWLQISCDAQCGETATSTTPDQTVAEFRADLGRGWVRFDGKDWCRRCYEAGEKKRMDAAIDRRRSRADG